tara:strand:- start:561 stop:944 length:384 start_codon:yes stop_codon:yes gene_type:complete
MKHPIHIYDRRRAIDCKLLKKSETHKGYCKYLVTVGELDGTITKHPVYGKDMQSALKRLLNTELTNRVERKLETSTGFIFLSWILLMGIPTVFGDTATPWYLIYVFGSIAMFMFVATWWYNYIKKGK